MKYIEQEECLGEIIKKNRFDFFCKIWDINDKYEQTKLYNSLSSLGYVMSFNILTGIEYDRNLAVINSL